MAEYIERFKPFFKDDADFENVQKLTDILEWPVETLKVFDEGWKTSFTDLDINTIQDLAQYKEPILLDEISSDEINKAAMMAEMIFLECDLFSGKRRTKKENYAYWT